HCLPSSVRVPATTWPDEGSMMSPTALTATNAATTRPFGRRMAAEPMPAFIGRPADLPTVAPAPAPTLPSFTGSAVAAAAALYPQSALGRIFGLPPNDRSNRIAEGTMGTTPLVPTR